mgnify:CR=1 FL=1|jgi:hypothetical protein
MVPTMLNEFVKRIPNIDISIDTAIKIIFRFNIFYRLNNLSFSRSIKSNLTLIAASSAVISLSWS